MTKREKIRERFAVEFYLWSVPQKPWTEAEEYKKGICLSIADELLEYLHSQGVAIKVERELPRDICQDVIDTIGATREDAGSYKRSQQDMLKAGCGFFEPLIEEGK